MSAVQGKNNSNNEQCQRTWQIDEKGRQRTHMEAQQNQPYLKHQKRNSQTNTKRTHTPKTDKQHHKKLCQSQGRDDKKSCSYVGWAKGHLYYAKLNQERKEACPEHYQNTYEQPQSPS